MNTNIGISEINRLSVANELAKLLADEYVLCTKTRHAHWNVEGIDFYEKHKFFESQFRQLDELIDDIAERIRTLGHYATSSLSVFLKTTHLSESGKENNDSESLIRELLGDHESIVTYLRENINADAAKFKDQGSSDFITGIMETHEKMAWLLRAHLPKSN
jgi:starvation-inducible DNA-binding protein